jgi:ubiquinone/menaquinone biosynthesis C-methylase UbiE
MGKNPPEASKPDDTGSTAVHRKVFTAKSSQCVETDTGICLNLGCGKVKWPNWINIDFENSDLNADLRKLPFPSDYADAIAAIHVLEHFYVWEVPDILQEWKRVLKPGGKIILELPCMDKVLKHMMQCVEQNVPMIANFTWFAFWGDPKYQDPHMCHKWGYSLTSIKELIEAHGFNNIKFETPNYHFADRDMRIVAYK